MSVTALAQNKEILATPSKEYPTASLYLWHSLLEIGSQRLRRIKPPTGAVVLIKPFHIRMEAICRIFVSDIKAQQNHEHQ